MDLEIFCIFPLVGPPWACGKWSGRWSNFRDSYSVLLAAQCKASTFLTCARAEDLRHKMSPLHFMKTVDCICFYEISSVPLFHNKRFYWLLILSSDQEIQVWCYKPQPSWALAIRPSSLRYSIFYVCHAESKLFFDLEILFPLFSSIQKMILTVPKLSCKPWKLFF